MIETTKIIECLKSRHQTCTHLNITGPVENSALIEEVYKKTTEMEIEKEVEREK